LSHGPSTMPAFGLVIDDCALPEFSGVSLSTRPEK
jgi:hypothetical protein